MENLIFKGNRINFQGKSISISTKEDLDSMILLFDTRKGGWGNPDDPNDKEVSIDLTDYELAYFNFSVDWGDGTIEYYEQSDIESLPQPNWGYALTHEYDEPGIYQVKLNGSIGGILYGWGDAGAKLLEVQQWGTVQWDSCWYAFPGCNNMDIIATDYPDLSNVSSENRNFEGELMFEECWNLKNMSSNLFKTATDVNGIMNVTFSYCTSLEEVPAGLFDNVNIAEYANGTFRYCENLNIVNGASNWKVGELKNMGRMFQGCGNIDVVGMEHWEPFKLEAGTGWLGLNEMFEDSTLPTERYSQVLINFASKIEQFENTGIYFGAGSSKYNTSAESARNILTSAPYNWVITDGGLDE